MFTSKFDISIVGGGVSGLHLALSLMKDNHFQHHKIALFEKEPKTENDKTWSFWEKENGQWDKLIHKKWSTGKIFALQKEVALNLKPFSYKTLRAIDFYNYAYQQLAKARNIEVIFETVETIQEEKDKVGIKTDKNEYVSDLVFNSRIPDFNSIKKEADFTLLQHFEGWFIESEKAVFNPDEFVMMDYRFKDAEQTSFIYLLPFSKHKALVEFTYFTPELVDDERYTIFLQQYIDEQLQLKSYKITDKERGVIPMSNYNFSQNHTDKIIQIGTAGGWVKASSGYSFKNAEKKAAKIVTNLKQGLPINKGLFHPKYKHYDSLFLDVLSTHNHLGEKVFYKLYAKNNIQTLLRFLDEETSYVDDFSIIKSLTSIEFIKAFFHRLFRKI